MDADVVPQVGENSVSGLLDRRAPAYGAAVVTPV